MADFEKLADVPKDVRDRCKFYGRLDGKTMFAESYSMNGDVLQLNNIVLDTSDVVNGVTLQVRWSFIEFLAVSSHFKWTLRSIGPEERP